jgi:NAD(P)-dependent dehydrogenase (short-subunit alcohol dehydrogenase family)
MNLALLDINSTNLKKAREVLKPKNNEKTETYTMNVSSTSDWSKVRADVESKLGSVDLLMLNAGVSFKPESGKQWEDPEYFHKTFAVNVFGPVNGLVAFLPLVQNTIIITDSKQDIMNPPGNSAYNASKSMVKTITEHLAHDLRTSNPNISVHLLIPSWTFTGLSGNSGPVPDEEVIKTKKPGSWLPN